MDTRKLDKKQAELKYFRERFDKDVSLAIDWLSQARADFWRFSESVDVSRALADLAHMASGPCSQLLWRMNSELEDMASR